MLALVKKNSQTSNKTMTVKEAEEQLLHSIAQSIVGILDTCDQAKQLLRDVGISQRDFIWCDVSQVFYRLSEVNIEWPAYIEDRQLQRFYDSITYIRTVLYYGAALRTPALHLV